MSKFIFYKLHEVVIILSNGQNAPHINYLDYPLDRGN